MSPSPSKVAEKIFAFIGEGTSVGVKCGANREEADEWLLLYPDDAAVMSYIGRSGWNTLRLNGAIPDDEIRDAIDDSYDTVVAKLPKRLAIRSIPDHIEPKVFSPPSPNRNKTLDSKVSP